MSNVVKHEQVLTARSFLFVPGDRPDRFAKVFNAGPDLVMLDLEDAVAATHKDDARQAVSEWLQAGNSGCVRINPHTTDAYRKDLELLWNEPQLTALMLPKADMESLAALGKQTDLPVIALIETAEGLDQAKQLAAQENVVRLAFGHLDFAADIGASPTHEAMLSARSHLVLASRLAGLPAPIDGVTTAFEDVETLRVDIRRAKDLGFTAKLLIHPKQISDTHDSLAPDEDDLLWAQTILETVKDGVGVVAGAMVDAPVLRRAQAIVRSTTPRT